MTIRFAIWAAVSSEAQAASDKVSLSEQESKCRAVALARGWQEAGSPFVVPGESRTRWVNLRDAETAIPELHHMLDAAQNGEYDVLVMYDYNRLRDLLDPVSKTLSHYGVQVFSVSQPVEPLPPEEFNPYASDASNMMQGLAKIISQAQISDLRRKYRYAMPRRIIERGLPVKIPWGYRKPPGREMDRTAVPVADPVQSALVIEAKEMLLNGQSLAQIVAMLADSGEPPPRGKCWYAQTVRDILRNPFYAGYVRFGVTQSKLDPRTGQRYRNRKVPANKIIIAQGQHKPLWDNATHQAIKAEISRRGRSYRGRSNNQFTGLLICGDCGKKLWTFYDGHYQGGEVRPEWRVWRCSTRQPHVTVKHDDLVSVVARELNLAIRNLSIADSAKPTLVGKSLPVDELLAQRQRLEDAYQAGLISLDSLSRRAAELDEQLAKAEQDAAKIENAERARAERIATLGGLAGTIDNIPDYLAHGDPQKINRLLHLLLERIVVRTPEQVELVFK